MGYHSNFLLHLQTMRESLIRTAGTPVSSPKHLKFTPDQTTAFYDNLFPVNFNRGKQFIWLEFVLTACCYHEVILDLCVIRYQQLRTNNTTGQSSFSNILTAFEAVIAPHEQWYNYQACFHKLCLARNSTFLFCYLLVLGCEMP